MTPLLTPNSKPRWTTSGPADNDFPVVVQIKANPDAKTVIEMFSLNLTDCAT